MFILFVLAVVLHSFTVSITPLTPSEQLVRNLIYPFMPNHCTRLLRVRAAEMNVTEFCARSCRSKRSWRRWRLSARPMWIEMGP